MQPQQSLHHRFVVSNVTIDAGFVERFTLGNFVFLDLSADGIQDDNEPGIANRHCSCLTRTTFSLHKRQLTSLDSTSLTRYWMASMQTHSIRSRSTVHSPH
jgi:hypothetical protein